MAYDHFEPVLLYHRCTDGTSQLQTQYRVTLSRFGSSSSPLQSVMETHMPLVCCFVTGTHQDLLTMHQLGWLIFYIVAELALLSVSL